MPHRSLSSSQIKRIGGVLLKINNVTEMLPVTQPESVASPLEPVYIVCGFNFIWVDTHRNKVLQKSKDSILSY